MIALVLAALIPAHEWAMIRQVAADYRLDRERTVLLAAIRRYENGRPGLEFGIGGPMSSGHPAHRFRDGRLSFLVQARWAAGTIARRYDGDLLKFARRYCPSNARNWYVGVSSLIERLEKETKKND